MKEFIRNWLSMCKKPVGNTMIISPLDDYFINEIKSDPSIYTEEDKYYIIEFHHNVIKIEK